MARVFLGLGSNLGDRRDNLCRAVSALREKVALSQVSSLYDTAPVGYADQPRFLNLVCAGETTLEAVALLCWLKRLETDLGRTPTVRFGPRVVDIDILLYGCNVSYMSRGEVARISQCSLPYPSDLTIPHPRLAERAFVLAPLAEIAPELVVPGTGRTTADLLAALGEHDVRRLPGEDGRLSVCTK